MSPLVDAGSMCAEIAFGLNIDNVRISHANKFDSFTKVTAKNWIRQEKRQRVKSPNSATCKARA